MQWCLLFVRLIQFDTFSRYVSAELINNKVTFKALFEIEINFLTMSSTLPSCMWICMNCGVHVIGTPTVISNACSEHMCESNFDRKSNISSCIKLLEKKPSNGENSIPKPPPLPTPAQLKSIPIQCD